MKAAVMPHSSTKSSDKWKSQERGVCGRLKVDKGRGGIMEDRIKC